MQSNSVQITKEMIDVAISLNACPEGVERAKLGFEFLTLKDKNWIASQEETSVEILERLSTDKDYLVRVYVALNPSTPVAILEKLSTDEAFFVRKSVTENPSSPISILEKLSTDEDGLVKYYVANNPVWIAYKK